MAAKPENVARVALNKLVPAYIHREKMGSPFSAGTPDQWYSGNHDLWIEFKFEPQPFVRPFTLKLSELQLLWLEGRYNEGRAVGVILLFPAKFGCWIFTNKAWAGKINPADCVLKTRQETADFIKRSCMDNDDHCRLIQYR